MSTIAKDMDRWIEKRDELSRRREDLVKQREATIKAQVIVYCHTYVTTTHVRLSVVMTVAKFTNITAMFQ